eukprot:4307586-Amphidinium_carterae.1
MSDVQEYPPRAKAERPSRPRSSSTYDKDPEGSVAFVELVRKSKQQTTYSTWPMPSQDTSDLDFCYVRFRAK